jgi:hypothetical protein
VPARWSLAHRLAFRFFCCYWILYALPEPGRVGLIPFGFLFKPYTKMWHAVVPLAATHVFHIAGVPATYFRTGSGDTTLQYVHNLLYVVVAGGGHGRLVSPRSQSPELRCARRLGAGAGPLQPGVYALWLRIRQNRSTSVSAIASVQDDRALWRLLPHGRVVEFHERIPALCVLFGMRGGPRRHAATVPPHDYARRAGFLRGHAERGCAQLLLRRPGETLLNKSRI